MFISRVSEKHKLVVIFLIYAVVIAVGLFFHEIWLDESQAWLIARDASLLDLFKLAGYEGSPVLWHLLLMPFAKLGLPIASMQVLQFIIILTAAGLLLKYAPFPWWMKALILASYPMFYEYAIISRSYGLGVLLIFAVLSAWPNRQSKVWQLALLITLLAQVHIFGLWLAICFVVYWLVDARKMNGRVLAGNLFLIALPILSIGLAVAMLWPPTDLSHSIAPFDFIFEWGDLEQLKFVITGAFFPIPDPGGRFWNNVWWSNQAVFSIGLFSFVVSYLSFYVGRSKLITLYSVMSSGMIILFLTKHLQASRYLVILVIILIACYWLAELEKSKSSKSDLGLSRAMVSVVLILQIPMAGIALTTDLFGMFSPSQQAAKVLRSDPDYVEVLLMSFPSQYGVSLLPFIDDAHKTVYGVEYERDVSYMVWNTEQSYGYDLGADVAIQRIEDVVAERKPKLAILAVAYDKDELWRPLLKKYAIYGDFSDALLNHEQLLLIDVTAPK